MNLPVTYTTTRRVAFRDTDAAGIAHFSTFFFWMEDVEHEFLRSRGLTVMPRKESPPPHVGWPRVSVACEYFRPIRFEDHVTVQLQVARIGAKSVTYEFEFSFEDQRVAAGKVIVACCNLGPNSVPQAVPIPEEFIRGLSAGAPDAWPT